MRFLPFLILLPYITDFAPADSSYDEFAIGLGSGQNAAIDCGGRTYSQRFEDVAIKGTHKFDGPLRVGVTAGYVANQGGGGLVGWPDLALDFKHFSIGTTGARVGSLDAFHAELAAGDQVPLFSGRGLIRIGVGWTAQDWNTRFWLGMNSVPYRKGALAGQIDFPIADDKFLFVNGRYGQMNSVEEFGVSVGFRMRGNWK